MWFFCWLSLVFSSAGYLLWQLSWVLCLYIICLRRLVIAVISQFLVYCCWLSCNIKYTKELVLGMVLWQGFWVWIGERIWEPMKLKHVHSLSSGQLISLLKIWWLILILWILLWCAGLVIVRAVCCLDFSGSARTSRYLMQTKARNYPIPKYQLLFWIYSMSWQLYDS